MADSVNLGSLVTAVRPRRYIGSSAVAHRIAQAVRVGPMRPAPHYVVKRVGNVYTQIFFTPDEVSSSAVLPQQYPLVIAPVNVDINNVDSMLAEWDIYPGAVESTLRDQEWVEASNITPMVEDGVSITHPAYGISNAALLSYMYYNPMSAIGQSGDVSVASTAARNKIFGDRVRHGGNTRFATSPLNTPTPGFMAKIFGATPVFPVNAHPPIVQGEFVDKLKTPASVVPAVSAEQTTWLESLIAAI